MTPPVPPPAAPAPPDVPATPTEAVTTSDPLGTPAQAASQAAEARRPTVQTLGIADVRAATWSDVYFTQIYQPNATKVVSSWDEMVATIAGYDHIGHLVLLTHAGGVNLECGAETQVVQKSPGQFADALLAAKVGAIDKVSFDGCALGAMPTGLLELMTKLRVPRVVAWTWGHWLDGWTKVLEGDVSGWTVDKVLAEGGGQFERAAPYLPGDAEGGTVSATAQAELLLRQRRFALVAELFVERMPDGSFAQLMADPTFQFDAKVQVPRSTGVGNSRDLATPKQAADFEEEVRLGGPFYRVVLRA